MGYKYLTKVAIKKTIKQGQKRPKYATNATSITDGFKDGRSEGRGRLPTKKIKHGKINESEIAWIFQIVCKELINNSTKNNYSCQERHVVC